MQIMQHDILTWFSHEPLHADQLESCNEILEQARAFATRVLSLTPQSEEQVIAIRKIRESVAWSIMAITGGGS